MLRTHHLSNSGVQEQLPNDSAPRSEQTDLHTLPPFSFTLTSLSHFTEAQRPYVEHFLNQRGKIQHVSDHTFCVCVYGTVLHFNTYMRYAMMKAGELTMVLFTSV